MPDDLDPGAGDKPEPGEPEPQPGYLKLLEPLRNEGAAFRLLLRVALAFVVLIALVLLVKALT